MDSCYKDQVLLLRHRISIRIRHGLVLLEKTGGDIAQAEQLFRQEILAITVDKSGVTEDIARRHLETSDFDIPKALKTIDGERYSKTELILIRCRGNKDNALRSIALVIEEVENINRRYWLQLDELENLKPEYICLLTVVEWLGYWGWESLDSALSFYVEAVAEQIRTKLVLPEIADSLLKLRDIYGSELEKQTQLLEKDEGRFPTPEYIKQRTIFESQEFKLIDALFSLVEKNIARFP